MFSDAKGVQELIELFGQSIDRALAQLQQAQLRPGPGVITKAVVNVLDDLERLTKVMAGHREKQCFEFAIVFRWSRHFPPGKEIAGACGGFNLAACAAHNVLSLGAAVPPRTTDGCTSFAQPVDAGEFSVARPCKTL